VSDTLKEQPPSTSTYFALQGHSQQRKTNGSAERPQARREQNFGREQPLNKNKAASPAEKNGVVDPTRDSKPGWFVALGRKNLPDVDGC